MKDERRMRARARVRLRVFHTSLLRELPLSRMNDDRALFFIAGEGWGEGEPFVSPHPNPLPPLSLMFLFIFFAGEGDREAAMCEALVNVSACGPVYGYLTHCCFVSSLSRE